MLAAEILLCMLSMYTGYLLVILTSLYETTYSFSSNLITCIIKNSKEAFVDLKKVFDQVPRKVIWCALRKIVWRVDCATSAGDVCQGAEPCPCWLGVQ